MSHLLYIDPGTGSLIYQGLLSGILTISIFFGNIKNFIKSKMSNNNRK